MEGVTITYQTKNDFVYYEIKKDILQKRLQAGERLVVSDLAKKYEMSPMPIREALIRLAQEEFVEIIPHVGAKVTSYNEEKLHEIHQIRTELESIATRFLAPIITDGQLRVLDDLMGKGRDIVQSSDVRTYLEWNRQFHYTIAEMNPNRTLEEYIKSDWQKLSLIGNRIGLQKWRSNESYREHQLWVEALRTRDPVKAEMACRTHCSAVQDSDYDNFLSW